MSEKKKMQKLDLSNFFIQSEDTELNESKNETIEHSKDEPLIIRRERKGRGGKVVTLVEGFNGSEDALETLCKELKQKLGIGGATKDGVIILQGDLCQKVSTKLLQFGYKTKIATL
jgi:translation initiation factor 1